MSRVIFRPNQAVDYGTVQTEGSGNVLGDGNWGTRKLYYDDSGSIMLYPAFDPALVPDGKDIIAVRPAHVQVQGGLFASLHNGWVMGYLRVNNVRQGKTKTYKQDGFNYTPRVIEGEPLYKSAFAPWLPSDINTMTTDVGAATGEFGPAKDKKWCICPESYIVIVVEDPVPVPTVVYPANNATIDTSSVDFKGNTALTQSEQPLATVFQVSRVNTFDDTTVQTFIGGLVQKSTDTSNYDSVVGRDSFTNLGPGKWYVRVKGRDFRNKESAWGVVTSFTIQHAALPAPVMTNPSSGGSKNTPYGVRAASISTQPVGERFVGIEFQFCQNSNFSTGPVVSWKNNAVGRYNVGEISYTADPDPTVAPGKNGDKVSTGDPDQYLKQGTWYARARCVDVYDQSGPWSSAVSFSVSHPPEVRNLWPSGGKAFDDESFPVRWKFGDVWTGDSQSAYQVVIRDQSNNLIYDTGKTNSPFNNTKVSIPSTYLEQTLRIAVQVWDKDGVGSPVVTDTFKLSTAPVINLAYPAAGQDIITGEPTLSWTTQLAPGATQKSFQIAFVRRDNGSIEYASPVMTSASQTWVPPTVVLKNVSAYQLALTVTDSNDLYTTLLRNFQTNYVRPPQLQCSVFVSDYENDGFVRLLWPGVSVDPLFIEFRLYRKNVTLPDQPWEQIGTVTDPNVFEFKDWSTSGAFSYKYALTQVVMLYGAKVESLPNEYGEVIQIQSSHYWLICPDNESLNTKLYQVVDDSSDQEIEMAQYNIKGGGTRVVFGATIGKTGTLSCQVRGSGQYTANEFTRRIERIQFEKAWCYLRNPFGEYLKIAITKISKRRLPGYGANDVADLDLPYVEVK